MIIRLENKGFDTVQTAKPARHPGRSGSGKRNPRPARRRGGDATASRGLGQSPSGCRAAPCRPSGVRTPVRRGRLPGEGARPARGRPSGEDACPARAPVRRGRPSGEDAPPARSAARGGQPAQPPQPVLSWRRRRSAIIEINSLFVGLPLMPDTVYPKYACKVSKSPRSQAPSIA